MLVLLFGFAFEKNTSLLPSLVRMVVLLCSKNDVEACRRVRVMSLNVISDWRFIFDLSPLPFPSSIISQLRAPAVKKVFSPTRYDRSHYLFSLLFLFATLRTHFLLFPNPKLPVVPSSLSLSLYFWAWFQTGKSEAATHLCATYLILVFSFGIQIVRWIWKDAGPPPTHTEFEFSEFEFEMSSAVLSLLLNLNFLAFSNIDSDVVTQHCAFTNTLMLCNGAK